MTWIIGGKIFVYLIVKQGWGTGYKFLSFRSLSDLKSLHSGNLTAFTLQSIKPI